MSIDGIWFDDGIGWVNSYIGYVFIVFFFDWLIYG